MRERVEADVAAPPFSLADFTATVDRQQAALFGFLRGMLGERELARDLTQDTFADAWRATQQSAAPWNAAHDEDERRRWLFAVAYRRAATQLRRRHVLTWTSLDFTSPLWRNGEEPLAEDDQLFDTRIVEAEALRAALARLQPDDVACLLLRVAQGFNAAEAAAILGVSVDAVAQRLSRARRRLRTVYLQQNPPDAATRGRIDDDA
jgi:RNA polymerase sigma-70 factor (ECF subfamily)